ncbi:hypothetical protein B0H13DRAFT_1662583, partial [Mycena leptocephala]
PLVAGTATAPPLVPPALPIDLATTNAEHTPPPTQSVVGANSAGAQRSTNKTGTAPMASATPAPPFEFTDDAPLWLRETVRVLSQVDLGCHYRSLLEAVIRVEHRFGFAENPQTGVGGEGRPIEIHAWIKSGRGKRQKGRYEAGVTNVADYARRWWSWWDSLQPSWRKRRADDKWEISGEYKKDWDWDPFWFPGQNGCIGIVAGLYFWGSSRNALGGAGEWIGDNREEWEKAVADVVWVIEGLEQALPAPKKKKGRAT